MQITEHHQLAQHHPLNKRIEDIEDKSLLLM